MSKHGRKWGNQQWFELSRDDVESFLPNGDGAYRVPDSLFKALARKVFIDNVKGLAWPWKPEHVEEAKLVARPETRENGKVKIKYKGIFVAKASNRTMDLDLFGWVIWNDRKQSFERIGIVAVGIRSGTGKGIGNSRSDKGPSLVGFALTIEDQFESKSSE